MRKKDLETVGFGVGIMFLLSWIWALFIRDYLKIEPIFKTLIGIIILYGLGLFLFKKIIKKISNSKVKENKVQFKTIIKCFLLQFTALILLTILIMILTTKTGNEINNDLEVLTPLMLFQLLIFNPIIEEYIFRKIFADKLLKHGELFFMLVSSFCFAIVHSVSLGVPQVIYTFILGMIWSYLVVKTGNIKMSVILHSLSNLFGSVIPQSLQRVSMEISRNLCNDYDSISNCWISLIYQI